MLKIDLDALLVILQLSAEWNHKIEGQIMTKPVMARKAEATVKALYQDLFHFFICFLFICVQ